MQWLVDRTELNKRSFYSLQNIRIGARLECGGHANRVKPSAGDEVCSFLYSLKIVSDQCWCLLMDGGAARHKTIYVISFEFSKF